MNSQNSTGSVPQLLHADHQQFYPQPQQHLRQMSEFPQYQPHVQLLPSNSSYPHHQQQPALSNHIGPPFQRNDSVTSSSSQTDISPVYSGSITLPSQHDAASDSTQPPLCAVTQPPTAQLNIISSSGPSQLQNQPPPIPSSLPPKPNTSTAKSTSSNPTSSSARTSKSSGRKSKSASSSSAPTGNPRVSQRIPKSCTACAKRKIRCNKEIPCKPCLDRGEGHLCAREVVVVKGLIRNLDAHGNAIVPGTVCNTTSGSTNTTHGPTAPPSSNSNKNNASGIINPANTARKETSSQFMLNHQQQFQQQPLHQQPFTPTPQPVLPSQNTPTLHHRQDVDISPHQHPSFSQPTSEYQQPAVIIEYSPSETSISPPAPIPSDNGTFQDFTDAYKVKPKLENPSLPPPPQNNPSYQQPITNVPSKEPASLSSAHLKLKNLENENKDLMNQVAWLQHLVTNMQISSASNNATSASSPAQYNYGSTMSQSPTHLSPFSNGTISKPNSPEESITYEPPHSTAALPTLPALENRHNIPNSPDGPGILPCNPISSTATAVNNTYADVIQAITVGIVGDDDPAKKSKSSEKSSRDETNPKTKPNGKSIKRAKVPQCQGSCCSGHDHGASSNNSHAHKESSFDNFVPALSRKPLTMRDNQLSCPSCSVGEMSHCFAARLPFSDESQVSKILYSLAYDIAPISQKTSTVLVNHALNNLNFMHSAIHPPSFFLEHDYFWSKYNSNDPQALFLNPKFDKNRGQYLWLAQWYAVMCLGCFFADRKLGRAAGLDPKLLQVLPHKLFAASFECLHRGEVFKYPDIRALQVLAVLGPCFQAFGAINMRNAYLNTSIYIAQRLNIDKLDNEAILNLQMRSDFTDPDSSTRFLDREMGRRIWWATVIADWSDNTGRYSVIHPSSFTTVLPANLDDQALLELSDDYKDSNAASNPQNSRPLPYMQAKPLSELTSVSFQLIQAKLAQTKRFYYANPSQQVLANLEQANHELNVLEASIPWVIYPQRSFNAGALVNSHCSDMALHFQRYLIEILIHFERLTINRIMSIYMPQTEWNKSCRAVCLESARHILAAAAIPASPAIPFEFKKHPSVTGNAIAAAVYVLLDLLDLSHRQRIYAKSQRTRNQYFDASDGISPPAATSSNHQHANPRPVGLDPEVIKERLGWVEEFLPVLEKLQALHPQAKRGAGIIRKLITSVLANRQGPENNVSKKRTKGRSRRRYKVGERWYNSDNETDDDGDVDLNGNATTGSNAGYNDNGDDDDDDDDDDDQPPTLYEIVQRLSILPLVSAAPSRSRMGQNMPPQNSQSRNRAHHAGRRNHDAPLPPPNSVQATSNMANGQELYNAAQQSQPLQHQNQQQQQLQQQHLHQQQHLFTDAASQNQIQQQYAQNVNVVPLPQVPSYAHQQYTPQPNPQPQSHPQLHQGATGFVAGTNPQVYGVPGVQYAGPVPLQHSQAGGLDVPAQSFDQALPQAPVALAGNMGTPYQVFLPPQQQPLQQPPLAPRQQPQQQGTAGQYAPQFAPQHAQQQWHYGTTGAPGAAQQNGTNGSQGGPPKPFVAAAPAAAGPAASMGPTAASGLPKPVPFNPTDVTTEDLEIMCVLNNQDWSSSLSNFNGDFDFSLSTLNQPPKDCPDDVEPF